MQDLRPHMRGWHGMIHGTSTHVVRSLKTECESRTVMA